MLMLITPGDKGEANINFFPDMDAMMSAMDWVECPEVMPTRWLTLEQAGEDPAYWGEMDAFLAEVKPMKLAPKETVITHELRSQ